MKKDSSLGLFINLGDGKVLMILGKDHFEIGECSVQRPTSPELLGYPELIQAARDFYQTPGRELEFFEAFDSFERTFRAPPAKNAPPPSQPSINVQGPPKIAEFLLTAMATTRTAEAMVGDLNERFTHDCEKLGRPRAVRLYRARTLRSLAPLLRRAIGKALKWGVVVTTVKRFL
jgi:hypothetical protein